ncbi:hypothetical protein FHS72_000825 [Loktanella ponticola]|uniref:Roadblock/LC7 domain-containing protein n=1 Tax=Yoonia ponticola TaxID=1524255 RepID=A0A7W9BIM0_9RHOB|nr:hypothetical protein [Yoonia ponticola]MBB5721218.1 hypothetical protein [Yoonia ponticola]
MASEELDALHSQFPQCETLAFADLSADMVLVTNTDAPQQREALNALCADAAKSLGKPGSPNFGDGQSDTALIATRERLTIFLRASGEPADVLCCICKPTIDVSAFLAAARPTLQKISSGS